MWRSLNGGQSWTNIAPATGGDKQWFTIDNTNSTGHGFQYQCWSTAGNNFGGRQFTRSTDGGFTWMNPINIPNSPIWGTLDVDTNGNLFIGGVNPSTGQFWCIRSTQCKERRPSHQLSTKAPPVNLGGDIDSGEPINPGGLVGQVFLAVDRSGTSTNNNIYMLASVQPTGFTTGSDVMFVRSTNGGLTFSAPHRINDDPVNHNKWHWFGTLCGRAEWAHRFRLAGHAQRREQHRFAALLFLQHRRRHYLVAQRRGEQLVQSIPRLSEPEQDGRLHDHRFR